VAGTQPACPAHTRRIRHAVVGDMIAVVTRHMFRLLVLLNLDKLRYALNAVKPGQRHLILGISLGWQMSRSPPGRQYTPAFSQAVCSRNIVTRFRLANRQ
jgi:hypothetical protein